MMKTNNIPKLRFPEFKSNYELLLLNDITKWSSGGTPSKQNELYWNGNIPWISASTMKGNVFINSDLKITEVGLKSGSKICKKGDLLLLVRGSMLFNKIPIGMAGVDVAFNQDLKSISVNEKSNSLFLLYWFLHSESIILDMVTSTGIGAGKLDLSDLQNLKLNLPSLPEQQKIASFLTAVDDKISNLKQKISLLEKYKKGVMQQIFSQQIRFKDENGNDYPEWEEKSLGEVVNFLKGKGLPKNEIKENGKFKCIHYGELFTKYNELISQVMSFTNTDEGIVLSHKNDVLMPTSDVTPNGLATASCLKEDNVILGGDILIIRQKKQVFDGQFFSYYVKQHRDKVMKLVSGSTVYHLYGSDMAKFKICLPKLEEQYKIVFFLTNIDEKIETTKLQLRKMEVWKKGLLQGMFC